MGGVGPRKVNPVTFPPGTRDGVPLVPMGLANAFLIESDDPDSGRVRR